MVYLSNKYKDTVSTRASLKMLNLAGVEVEEYKGRYKEVLMK